MLRKKKYIYICISGNDSEEVFSSCKLPDAVEQF